MTGDGQLMLIKEVVLNTFLIMFIAVEVIILEVIQEATSDCSDPLDVHLGTAKLLFTVLDCVLKVFKSENQL